MLDQLEHLSMGLISIMQKKHKLWTVKTIQNGLNGIQKNYWSCRSNTHNRIRERFMDLTRLRNQVKNAESQWNMKYIAFDKRLREIEQELSLPPYARLSDVIQ